MYSRVLLAVDVSEASKLLVEHLPNLIKVGLKEVVWLRDMYLICFREKTYV